MAIPDFQSLMLPILELARDGEEHMLAEAREVLAQRFGLTDAERAELLPSGRQRRFDNRVTWAKVHLAHAGLLSSKRRGYFEVTQRGRDVLAEKPQRVDLSLLVRFEAFRQFRGVGRKRQADEPAQAQGPSAATETPEEMLEQAHDSIRGELAADLLERVKANTPQFFEDLVVELLLKMGYGRSRAEAGRSIGRSGDEGIDGIISEDRLGLETIYIQAKRWEGTVGRPEIQRFVGALQGKRARKGVFITTGTFSADARDYVSHIDPRVVLIDGGELAEHMIDHDLGVAPRITYEIKRVDSDYFVDE